MQVGILSGGRDAVKHDVDRQGFAPKVEAIDTPRSYSIGPATLVCYTGKSAVSRREVATCNDLKNERKN